MVVMLGNIRGGAEAHCSTMRNVISPLNADIALLSDAFNDKSNIFYKIAKYKWIHSLENLTAKIDAIAEVHNVSKEYWRKHALAEWRVWLGGLTIDGKKTENIFSAGLVYFRYVLKSKHMNVLKKYDAIILTRADHYYFCEHQMYMPVPGELFIPAGESYGGYNDRHSIFHPSDAEKVLGSLDLYVTTKASATWGEVNIESVLKRTFDYYKLKVTEIPRIQFTVKRKEEKTGHPGMGESNLCRMQDTDLYVKYGGEYADAKRNCVSNTITPNYHFFWFMTGLMVVEIAFQKGFQYATEILET